MYDATTALIVVDVQNDFADPQGRLYVKGGEEVVDVVNRALADAVKAGAVVVYTQDWHPQSTPHFVTDGGPWPVHCVAGSWGAELHPDLHRVDGAIFIRKGSGGEDGYSGFSVRDSVTGTEQHTGLADELHIRGVERVVVAGLATDYCVRETVLDALRLGFPTDVLIDAIRAVDLEPGDGATALADVHGAGAHFRES